MKASPQPRQIGIFGGSFDPIHCGHLLVAQAACEELELDRFFFVPAAQSPFKPEANPAPATARVRLLRLALAGQAHYEIDEQEIHRGGTSYTIETLRDYAARFPGSRLFCLIGADHVPTLPAWREAKALAELAEFIVIPRPGERSQPLPEPFRGHDLTGFPLGISSSQIRRRIRENRPIQGLVPDAVAEAIRNSRLYL